MDQLNGLFSTILDWLLRLGAFCMSFLKEADVFARARMTELGWSAQVQTLVEVVLAATFVLLLLRVFAPVLRVVLIVLLLILALQYFYPSRVRHAVQVAPCASAA